MSAAGEVRFGARLAAAMADHGPLCVGIDPSSALLASWGLPDDASGLRTFALTVAEALVGRVAALKPQSAFFERHGSAGIAVLEEVLATVRGSDGGTQVILDAKRGDIGSTMDAYAEAYLRDGAPLACDALTVSPYLGFGSLEPALRTAEETGRGLFVLALTSNPEGAQVQHATADGSSVAGLIAREAAARNARELAGPQADEGLGSVGLVVGATIGDAAQRLGVDLAAVRGPLLAPGVGAQGGRPEDLERVFGAARRTVLASASREVLAAGPGTADLRSAARRLGDAVAGAVR